jgi:hypothetical protein
MAGYRRWTFRESDRAVEESDLSLSNDWPQFRTCGTAMAESRLLIAILHTLAITRSAKYQMIFYERHRVNAANCRG